MPTVDAGDVNFTHIPTIAYGSGSAGQRLGRTVYITDAPYNASAGGADITVPLQSAINSGASEIIIPSAAVGSVYFISSTINIPSQVKISGQSPWPTVIRSTDLDAPIFYGNNANHVTISNLHLEYSGTPLPGADAILANNCQYWNIEFVWVNSSWNGFHANSNSNKGNHKIVGFRSFNYENSGLCLTGTTLDVQMTNFRFHAGNSERGRGGGIQLIGGVEAFTASQGDITLGVHGIVTDGASTSRGESPWYNKISQVYFDSAKEQGAYLRRASHLSFVDCWFASSGHNDLIGYAAAADYSGVDASACSFLKFIGGEFYNNGGRGALIYADNKFIIFNGITIKRNQFSRSIPGSGIDFVTGASDFVVQNCVGELDADTAKFKQTTLVNVWSGPSNRYIVADNLLGSLVVTDGGTGSNKRVANNY